MFENLKNCLITYEKISHSNFINMMCNISLLLIWNQYLYHNIASAHHCFLDQLMIKIKQPHTKFDVI